MRMVDAATSSGDTVSVDLDDQREVIEHLGHIVREVARSMYNRLRGHVEQDDLEQNGYIGLLQAAQSFKPEYGASIMAHASRRIRGAMLDGIRDMDWIPRRVRRTQRLLMELDTHGMTRTEVKEALGVTDEQLDEAMSATQSAPDIDMEATIADQPLDEGDPALLAAIGKLAPRDQTIITLYYWNELTLSQIGEYVGLGESGVHVARRKAERKLRIIYQSMAGEQYA